MHRFPLILSCTSKRVGRIWAGIKLQVVCKGIHCSKVSFSTFSVVATRVPGFKRLNSLLCLLPNLQNCKQRTTRKAQIPPVSTLTCPLPKRRLIAFSAQPFALATFFKLQGSLFIMAIHTVIYIYTYVCVLLAAHIEAHLLGWHTAHQEVGRSISLKRNCQAVMGFGGQPRALLSPGKQASQGISSLCCTPHDHAHWHACQSKEDFKEERKEESWLVLQTMINTCFMAVITVDNASVAKHRPTII